VINPQNGHILDGPTSPRDVFVAKSFPSESAREVRKVRSWTRKRCKTEPTLSRIRRDYDDTQTAAILCKIAQLTWGPSVRIATVAWSSFLTAQPKWAIQTSYSRGPGRSWCQRQALLLFSFRFS